MAGNKIYTLDKFWGVNEAADGSTEMALGEASKIENFYITDGYNLETRPGIVRIRTEAKREPAPILATWSGYIGEDEALVIVDFYGGKDRIFVYQEVDGNTNFTKQENALGLTQEKDSYVKVFSFGGNLFIMSVKNTVMYKNGTFVPADIYIPKVIINSAPSGGGEVIDNFNLLTSLRQIEFSADGTSTAFVFPEEAKVIKKLEIDNVSQDIASKGAWDAAKHTFTFKEAPVKGVSNVMFEYDTDAVEAEKNRMTVVRMTLTENYNGSTDTRLFMAGDGTDLIIYSGVPDSGDLSKLYFPAMYEIKADQSGSPVTGLIRHYGKLLAFKKDEVISLTYSPLTLPDGRVTAGFYPRPVSKGIGNDLLGQLQTVDNYPRSISHGSVYAWRMENQGYRDERNYVEVSSEVERTLKKADYKNIITCDDNHSGTYYVFLNDAEGTVLVNRYLLRSKSREVWTTYKSEMFRGVKAAVMFNDDVTFVKGGEVFHLSEAASADVPQVAGGEPIPIKAVWESGFMAFGADYLRKYSSIVYVSVRPQSFAEVAVTARTDRRNEYLTKFVQEQLFSFINFSFPRLSFSTMDNPQLHRVKLKVKKFKYYQLILKSEAPYSKATILGIDQQVRYSSMAK